MSGGASILGPQKDRIKTDVRLPPQLMKQVGVVCEKLGVPKNAFFTVAACKFLIELSPLLTVNKKAILEQQIADLLQKVLDNIRQR